MTYKSILFDRADTQRWLEFPAPVWVVVKALVLRSAQTCLVFEVLLDLAVVLRASNVLINSRSLPQLAVGHFRSGLMTSVVWLGSLTEVLMTNCRRVINSILFRNLWDRGVQQIWLRRIDTEDVVLAYVPLQRALSFSQLFVPT